MEPLDGETTLQAPTCDLSDFEESRRLAEQLLEDRRPPDKPSRISSWFACDKPENAARYLEAERQFKANKLQGTPELYQFETEEFSKHPMCLVESIRKALLSGDTALAEALADEYWSPKQDWRFWEYLGPRIVGATQVDWPTPMDQYSASLSYSSEYKRVKTFEAALSAAHTHSKAKE